MAGCSSSSERLIEVAPSSLFGNGISYPMVSLVWSGNGKRLLLATVRAGQVMLTEGVSA